MRLPRRGANLLNRDRKVKLALYARSGIPEVWVVNLVAGQVEVYRSPVADGYASVARLTTQEDLTMEALPDVRIPVIKLFS